MLSKYYWLLLFSLTFILLACRNSQKVDLKENCLNELNLTFFRGIHPGMTPDELYSILGKPDDQFEVKEDEDVFLDFAYYNNQGRLLLHCGYDDGIGMIEFRPKFKLKLYDFINNKYVIDNKRVILTCQDKMMVTIELENDLSTIKEIYWWHK